jgi:hypothetical protein
MEKWSWWTTFYPFPLFFRGTEPVVLRSFCGPPKVLRRPTKNKQRMWQTLIPTSLHRGVNGPWGAKSFGSFFGTSPPNDATPRTDGPLPFPAQRGTTSPTLRLYVLRTAVISHNVPRLRPLLGWIATEASSATQPHWSMRPAALTLLSNKWCLKPPQLLSILDSVPMSFSYLSLTPTFSYSCLKFSLLSLAVKYTSIGPRRSNSRLLSSTVHPFLPRGTRFRAFNAWNRYRW